jgi:hypothetical protein
MVFLRIMAFSSNSLVKISARIEAGVNLQSKCSDFLPEDNVRALVARSVAALDPVLGLISK